jgi:heme a synthase
MNRALRGLAALTTVVMFVVLLMGALVTNTGSGDGCGAHWPLCHGTFMPDWDYEAMIEFSHRAVSGVAGMLVLALAVWVWLALPKRPQVRWLAVGSLFLVCLQGALGAMAVIWPQPKAVLALHFGISLLCFSGTLLVWSLLGQEERPARTVPPQLTRWVWTVAAFAYAVVYLGALVRHLKASLACLGWPLCNGQLIPTLYGLTGVHFIHRLAAALLTVMVIRTAFVVRRLAPDRRDLRVAADVAVGLVLAQVASGALMPLGYYNLLTQETHTGIVTLFWGALSYLCFHVLKTEPVTKLGAHRTA